LFLNVSGQCTIKISTYFVSFFMKESGCSHKLRYEGYLELMCRCLSNNIYIELSHIRISYGEIICL
jgi:hypothetical protein